MKILILCFLILGSSAFGQNLPYQDEQFSCITESTAQRYIKDFNIQYQSFGGVEPCNSQSDFKKLVNDLSIIENGRFQTAPARQLIGGFIESSKYYLWLKLQTRSMDRKSNLPTAAAYNIGGMFTMQDNWARLSTLGRVGVLIHEARHTVGHRHTTCTTGPYSDIRVDACDKDFASGGSHAVEMEYYARVSTLGQNFHPVYRAMARLMAMARSNFVFNKSPLVPREGLLVQSQSGQYFLMDQGRWFERPPITYALRSVPGVLKRTSSGASLFTGTQAFAIELYEGFDPFEILTDSYSYFKILLEGATNLRDFEEFDIGNKRHVISINNSYQFSTYNFSQGRWNSAKPLGFPIMLSSTYLADGRQGYFIVDNNSRIFSFQPATSLFVPLGISWDLNAQTVARVNNQIYSLNSSGKLFTLKNKQWQSVSLPQGIPPKQMVSVPLYNTFNILE